MATRKKCYYLPIWMLTFVWDALQRNIGSTNEGVSLVTDGAAVIKLEKEKDRDRADTADRDMSRSEESESTDLWKFFGVCPWASSLKSLRKRNEFVNNREIAVSLPIRDLWSRLTLTMSAVPHPRCIKGLSLSLPLLSS